MTEIYRDTDCIEKQYPLESILPYNTNKHNLESACAIIREAGWAEYNTAWDDKNIFSEQFFQLMDIVERDTSN